MIGKKFYKNDFTNVETQRGYAECADWCNETQQGIIVEREEYYECIAYVPTETPIDDTPTIQDLVEAISILTDYVFGESEVADNG